MNPSTVTSAMHLPGNLFPASVLLRDGAEPVFVHDDRSGTDLFGGMATYPDRDGRLTLALCYCGPEAPDPGRYVESVTPEGGAQYYTFQIVEHIGGRIYQWHERAFTSLIESIGIEAAWRIVRERYRNERDEVAP